MFSIRASSSSFSSLSLCLDVLKHRAPLARGAHLPAKFFFRMEFCLCGAVLNLKVFLNFLGIGIDSFIKDKLKKIVYVGVLFKVWFIQDSVLFWV
jgi:hypothetical protein